jgi:hypothetical protein
VRGNTGYKGNETSKMGSTWKAPAHQRFVLKRTKRHGLSRFVQIVTIRERKDTYECHASILPIMIAESMLSVSQVNRERKDTYECHASILPIMIAESIARIVLANRYSGWRMSNEKPVAGLKTEFVDGHRSVAHEFLKKTPRYLICH